MRGTVTNVFSQSAEGKGLHFCRWFLKFPATLETVYVTPLTFDSGIYRLFALYDSIHETHTAARFLSGLLKDIGIFEFDHLSLYSILALFIK